MDLQQYKKMIQDKLLHDVKTQMAYEQNVASGNYIKTPKRTKKIQKKALVEQAPVRAPAPSPVQVESTDADDELTGGKMHHPKFLKHMKKFGHTLSHAGKAVGHELVHAGKEVGKVATSEVVKQAGKELGKYALDGAKVALMAEAPEIGVPLMLATSGSGMKKPKQKRQQSEKQKRRHALVSKLMREHGCSLGDASKYIKEHNIDY